MIRSTLRIAAYAGVLVSTCLLASTPGLAQQVVRSAGPMPSIISLSPSPRPQGTFLARRAQDARFENAPANYHVFEAAIVGEQTRLETLTLNFAGATTLTAIETTNKDFQIQPGGSCYAGNRYSAGQSCSLLVRFTPQGPGRRLGFVKITNSAESSATMLGMVANGYSPVISFTPSIINTVRNTVASGTGTISTATRLATDGGDILYIADVGNSLIKKIDSSGTIANIGPMFAMPLSIAVDSFGFIYGVNAGAGWYFTYYYPSGSQTAYATTYAPGACTVSTPCALKTVGMSNPANVSMDGNDNLFFEEATLGAAEMPVSGIAASNAMFPPLSLWYLNDIYSYSSTTPRSFSVDLSGNLYTAYINSGAKVCYLLEEDLYDAEYTPRYKRMAGGSVCGFSGDGGPAAGAQISSNIGQMAFDLAGNLYFADAGNQRVRRIDRITGTIRTIAGTGSSGYTGDGSAATRATLSNPTGVSVDSQGRVYILSSAPANAITQAVRVIGTTGRLTLNSAKLGTSSPAGQVLVSNTGNYTMTLTNTVMSGTNPGDFAVDPATTTCSLAPNISGLAPGRSCQIGFIFSPKATGTRTAYFNLLSNTTQGINQIYLSGSGLAAVSTAKFVAPTASTILVANANVSMTVSVTSKSGVLPTGTMTFKVDGKPVGTATVKSGSASLSVSPLVVGAHTLSAAYSGDKSNAPASANMSVTVKTSANTN